MLPKWTALSLTLAILGLIQAVSSLKCHVCNGPSDCSSTLTRYAEDTCKTHPNREPNKPYLKDDILCFLIADRGIVTYKGCGRRWFIGLMTGGVPACRETDGDSVLKAVQWINPNYLQARSSQVKAGPDPNGDHEQDRQAMLEYTKNGNIIFSSEGAGGREYKYSEHNIYRICACQTDNCNRELGVIGENYPEDGIIEVNAGFNNGGSGGGSSSGSGGAGNSGGGGNTGGGNSGGGNTGGGNRYQDPWKMHGKVRNGCSSLPRSEFLLGGIVLVLIVAILICGR